MKLLNGRRRIYRGWRFNEEFRDVRQIIGLNELNKSEMRHLFQLRRQLNIADY